MSPNRKKIAFACDHRGFLFKAEILQYLKAKNFDVIDCGTHSEASVDYNDYILQAAELVRDGRCDLAIGVCHTGIGSTIMANKVRGLRAALVHNREEAALSRAHNDSNMLILGSGFLNRGELVPILEVWLTTSFEGGRHERRVNKIKNYEQNRAQ